MTIDTAGRGPMGAFEGYGDFDTTDQQAVTVAQVLQEIVNATTVGKRGSCVTRSKYGSYPSSLYHAAVAALATQPATSQEGEWLPMDGAPIERFVLVTIADGTETDVVEAMQYRESGWTMFGCNGARKIAPLAWMEKPAALAQVKAS